VKQENIKKEYEILHREAEEAARQVLEWYQKTGYGIGIDPMCEVQLAEAMDNRLSRMLSDVISPANEELFDRSIDGMQKVFDWIDDAKERFCGMLRELLCSMNEKSSEISEKLLGGIAIHRIIALQMDLSALHSHQRSVAVIETDAGKFLYKNHDLKIDRCFGEFVSRFFADVIRVPAVVECEGFGFTEFIENTPASLPEKAKRYYENFGGFFCIAEMLGSSDLYCDNFLASDTFPVPIDLETILSPLMKTAQKPAFRAFENVRSLNTVSRLLPHHPKGFEELSPLFSQDQRNASAPVLDGVRQTAKDFMPELISGYQRIYRRCMEKKKEINMALDLFTGCHNRIVLRSNSSYNSAIRELHSWMAICFEGFEKEYQAALAARLQSVYGAESELVGAEMQALEENDIPYFYSLQSGRGIYAAGKELCPEYFLLSGIENAKQRLYRMSEERMNLTARILQIASSKTIDYVEQPAFSFTVNKEKSGLIPITAGECVSLAGELFDRIESEAMDLPGGGIEWFTASKEEDSLCSFMGSGVADGICGIALFYQSLAVLTENSRIRKRAQSQVDRIIGMIEDVVSELSEADQSSNTTINKSVLLQLLPNGNASELLGFANGLGGMLFALDRITTLRGTKEAEQTFECIAGKILHFLMQQSDLEIKGDVYSGASGLILTLGSLHRLKKRGVSQNIIKSLAEQILQKKKLEFQGMLLCDSIGEGKLISGAACGQSGIAAALFKAANLLKKPKYAKEAEGSIRYEFEIYDEVRKGWPDLRGKKESEEIQLGWYSGASGIGLESLRLMNEESFKRMNPEIQKMVSLNLERALAGVKTHVAMEDIPFMDSLCLGKCSMVDFLIDAGGALKDEDAGLTAGLLLKEIAENYHKNGEFRLKSPEYVQPFFVDLFYGAAGIGYELLRYADPFTIQSSLL